MYGKLLARNAQLSSALNDQQHGSRPWRMTTDAMFLGCLEKDLIRQTKANSAHVDADATGSYDRIVTLVVDMIACRQLALNAHTARCQAETLRRMKYSVKHAFGVRSLIIQVQRRSPSLKRVRAVEPLLPSGWLCLVVLLNSLDRISSEDNIPSLAFSDPWQEISEAWRVGAFVDDTNQGEMDSTNQGEMDSTGHLGLLDLVEQLCHAGQT